MFCHKCGTQLPDEAEFCHKCGSKVHITEPEPVAHASGSLYCPHCNSQKLQTIVETNTKGSGGGYGTGKGCLGFLLLGPLGLLCGACGSKAKITTTNKTFFMCMDCGNKFQEANELAEEKRKESTFSFIAGAVCAVLGVFVLTEGKAGGLGILVIGGVLILAGVLYKKESDDIDLNEYEADNYKKK